MPACVHIYAAWRGAVRSEVTAVLTTAHSWALMAKHSVRKTNENMCRKEKRFMMQAEVI